MEKIYIRKKFSAQDWNNIEIDRHTKFLFVKNEGLIVQGNYINELRKYAKKQGYKYYTIVLNDKYNTNILY